MLIATHCALIPGADLQIERFAGIELLGEPDGFCQEPAAIMLSAKSRLNPDSNKYTIRLFKSDNLFEYALVTRDTVVALDGPASFSQIFEEPLAEFADQLDQRGFGCLLDLGEEDVCLQVYRPYIRRIFDNIASNIFKYADPAHPVLVSFMREGEQAGLAFANVPLPPDTGGAESTKVGLISVQTMMEKMQAEVEVSQTARQYCITLLFPVKQI